MDSLQVLYLYFSMQPQIPPPPHARLPEPRAGPQDLMGQIQEQVLW